MTTHLLGQAQGFRDLANTPFNPVRVPSVNTKAQLPSFVSALDDSGGETNNRILLKNVTRVCAPFKFIGSLGRVNGGNSFLALYIVGGRATHFSNGTMARCFINSHEADAVFAASRNGHPETVFDNILRIRLLLL